MNLLILDEETRCSNHLKFLKQMISFKKNKKIWSWSTWTGSLRDVCKINGATKTNRSRNTSVWIRRGPVETGILPETGPILRDCGEAWFIMWSFLVKDQVKPRKKILAKHPILTGYVWHNMILRNHPQKHRPRRFVSSWMVIPTSAKKKHHTSIRSCETSPMCLPSPCKGFRPNCGVFSQHSVEACGLCFPRKLWMFWKPKQV